MLRRQDFTRTRVDALFEEARRQGRSNHFWSHEEREADRRALLEQMMPGEDLWVFGYGSLIWNPAFHFVERRRARLYGFHRSFCLWLTLGRGSPQRPGLMLALNHGGSCVGIAYRIAAAEVESETDILWMREMISPAYSSRWVQLQVDGTPRAAVTFVINRESERYTGPLAHERAVRHLATAHGSIGSSREYLNLTVAALREEKIYDRRLETLHEYVAAHDSE
ncbi:MAG: gamma-glutamylcyclotransferase [Gammaproteobacteria bacterium]|nr:gamma-glutamylcyclotransferase [Gammaproteobacteria bacterium]